MDIKKQIKTNSPTLHYLLPIYSRTINFLQVKLKISLFVFCLYLHYTVQIKDTL